MTAHDPASVLSRFSEFVEGNMGLHFPPDRIDDLRRGLTSAALEFGFTDISDCIRWLMSTRLSKAQVEILASHLTVGETYFLRDRRVFAALEQQILPALIRSKSSVERQLRIWSAACCSGEESYSIAISVQKLLSDTKGWPISILGTDINPRFLQKASTGVFSEWSFRDTPAGFKGAYFKKLEEGRWEIRRDIRKMVTFLQLNLVEDVYPSLLNNTNALDVIFCRNVLIYFAPEQARRVIRNLTRCLREGGWLVLGPNETMHVSFPDLSPARFPGTVVYQKLSAQTQHSGSDVPSSSAIFEEPAITTRQLAQPQDPSVESAGPVMGDRLEGSHRSLCERALNFYELGRYDQAVEILRDEAFRQTADLQAMSLLTRSLANQGNLEEALSSSNGLIAADKLNPTGHFLRASILQEQGNCNEAEATFKRALYLDPEFVLAHFALGNLTRSQGKVTESERHFTNALALVQVCPSSERLPEGDGLTAGRLAEIITALRTSQLKEVSA